MHFMPLGRTTVVPGPLSARRSGVGIEKVVEPAFVVLERVIDAHGRRGVVELDERLIVGLEFFRALTSPTGLRVSSTPLTSASDSRRRDKAKRTSGPKMKATTAKRAPAPNTITMNWPAWRPRPRMKNTERHTRLANSRPGR